MRVDRSIYLGQPFTSVGPITGLQMALGLGIITISGTSGGTGRLAGPGPNEPSGMTALMNLNPITIAPNNGGLNGGGAGVNGTLSGAVPWNYTVFSQITTPGPVDWGGNLTKTPGETGWRLTYQAIAGLGGNSPARWGGSFAPQASFAAPNVLYSKFYVRLSSNWSLSNALGIKFVRYQPSAETGENHFLTFGGNGWGTNGGPGSTYMPFLGLLQFNQSSYFATVPYQNVVSPQQAFGSKFTANDIGDANVGTWFLCEEIRTSENPAGANNGRWQFFIGGVQMYDSGQVPNVGGNPPGGIRFFESGNNRGWYFMQFDSTYGGDASSDHPPTACYYDWDAHYISGK